MYLVLLLMPALQHGSGYQAITCLAAGCRCTNGLSPKNKISGGKIIGRDKRKTKNRAGLALRLAAGTLLESRTYLGAQYRRFRTKLGAPKARKAMGARLARIIYRMLKYGQEYMDKGNEFYEQKYRQLQIRRLTKKAAELGFEIVKAA